MNMILIKVFSILCKMGLGLCFLSAIPHILAPSVIRWDAAQPMSAFILSVGVLVMVSSFIINWVIQDDLAVVLGIQEFKDDQRA